MTAAALARLRRVDPSVGAVLLAAFVAVVDISGAALVAGEPDEPDLSTVAVALLLTQTVPLVWRRRNPVAVWTVTGLAAAAYGVAELPDPVLPLGLLVAFYTVVAYCSRRVALLAGGVTLVVGLVATAAAGDSNALDYYFGAVVIGLTWLLGDRAVRIRLAQADEAKRALSDERARIARELHDVVAHHVSMMIVQCEAGASLASAPPEQVSAAFDAVGSTGREAMGEMRRLLGMLRHDGDGSATAPQPGVAQMPALVASMRSAGLPVDLRVEGEERPLPGGVDLCAYRIVQEALTNTVRHAGASRVTVVVRYGRDDVGVEVVDDGRGPSFGNDGATGQGLVGIRERVALFGGALDIGPARGGGFAVCARLPTGS